MEVGQTIPAVRMWQSMLWERELEHHPTETFTVIKAISFRNWKTSVFRSKALKTGCWGAGQGRRLVREGLALPLMMYFPCKAGLWQMFSQISLGPHMHRKSFGSYILDFCCTEHCSWEQGHFSFLAFLCFAADARRKASEPGHKMHHELFHQYSPML